jgi:catechol-2,3-dioxygenase
MPTFQEPPMLPQIEAFDHIHVHVADRAAAEQWYRDVLGFTRTPELAFWARDGGPLTLQNASGSVHLALFERPRQNNHATIALRVNGAQFAQWLAHLRDALDGNVVVEDHELSVSLYFKDPDGNPYEITTYDHAAARPLIR